MLDRHYIVVIANNDNMDYQRFDTQEEAIEYANEHVERKDVVYVARITHEKRSYMANA